MRSKSVEVGSIFRGSSRVSPRVLGNRAESVSIGWRRGSAGEVETKMFAFGFRPVLIMAPQRRSGAELVKN